MGAGEGFKDGIPGEGFNRRATEAQRGMVAWLWFQFRTAGRFAPIRGFHRAAHQIPGESEAYLSFASVSFTA
jgi:hypothetical protein